MVARDSDATTRTFDSWLPPPIRFPPIPQVLLFVPGLNSPDTYSAMIAGATPYCSRLLRAQDSLSVGSKYALFENATIARHDCFENERNIWSFAFFSQSPPQTPAFSFWSVDRPELLVIASLGRPCREPWVLGGHPSQQTIALHCATSATIKGVSRSMSIDYRATGFRRDIKYQ